MTQGHFSPPSSDHPEGSVAVGINSAENSSPARRSNDPFITIFAIPKPFDRGTDLIQRNAIKSWARLQPQAEVLLIGDEEGIAETASELGVRHAGGIKRNEQGTPLVDSAFEIARRNTDTPFLCYCNCDVILMKDFVRAIEILASDETFKQFVAFGQRTDLRIDHEINFDHLLQIEQLLETCKTKGQLSSNVCKEYFVFNRGLYEDLPPFAIGRGNWDNWMIHSAKQNQLPVVSVSDLVTAIHQSHDYSHAGCGRFKCYVSGPEAKENMRLADGRHVISGSTANWRLKETGLRREQPWLINPVFWADIPRFVRLMLNMMFG